jgi:hypothetical protein
LIRVTTDRRGLAFTIEDGEVTADEPLFQSLADSYTEMYAARIARTGVANHEDHDLLLAQEIAQETGGTMDLSGHEPPDTGTELETVY